jgi:hypothetical protein
MSGGIAGARNDLNRLVAGVTSAKSLIVGAFGAMGVALSANAVKNWIGGQMDAIDATGKLASQLSITTENLVGLQHAASLADVDNELLGQGLRKLTQNLDDARNGTGAAGKALTSLGLDARRFTDSGVAFEAIADKIAGIEDPFKRAGLAADIFGAKAGPRLLTLLMSGAAGIRQAREEARRMGLTFSELDFAAVERGNDAITRLKGLAEGAGRTLAIELAPHVENLATQLFDAGAAGEGFGAKVSAGFEQAAISAAKFVDTLNSLERGRKGLADFLTAKTTQLDLTATRSRISNLEGQLAPGANTPEKFRAGMAEQLEQERERLRILEAQVEAAKDGGAAATNYAAAVAASFASMREDAAFTEKWTELGAGNTGLLATGAERARTAFEGMEGPIDRSANALGNLEKRVASFNASQFKNARGLQMMLDALEQQALGTKAAATDTAVKPPPAVEFGNQLAAAVERRFTFTTNNANDTKVNERQLREQEQIKKNTKDSATATVAIANKLNSSGTISIFTLN